MNNAPNVSCEYAKSRENDARGKPGGAKTAAIIGVIIACLLCVASLLARAELTSRADRCSQLEERIEELSDERARLLIEYERSCELSAVEDYALNVLGMRRASPEQIIYIRTSGTDTAEILK